MTSAGSGLTVTGRDVLLREFDDQKTIADFTIHLVVTTSAGCAAITVINTLASSTTARRRASGRPRRRSPSNSFGARQPPPFAPSRYPVRPGDPGVGGDGLDGACPGNADSPLTSP
jgi:hypothetical protein